MCIRHHTHCSGESVSEGGTVGPSLSSVYGRGRRVVETWTTYMSDQDIEDRGPRSFSSFPPLTTWNNCRFSESPAIKRSVWRPMKSPATANSGYHRGEVPGCHKLGMTSEFVVDLWTLKKNRPTQPPVLSSYSPLPSFFFFVFPSFSFFPLFFSYVIFFAHDEDLV
jgi:hypothetical protein